jgi:hypothetical protein
VVVSRIFIASALRARARAREIIVERRVPPQYGWVETPASPSKGMLTGPDYASATKKCGQFIATWIETAIHDG